MAMTPPPRWWNDPFAPQWQKDDINGFQGPRSEFFRANDRGGYVGAVGDAFKDGSEFYREYANVDPGGKVLGYETQQVDTPNLASKLAGGIPLAIGAAGFASGMGLLGGGGAGAGLSQYPAGFDWASAGVNPFTPDIAAAGVNGFGGGAAAAPVTASTPSWVAPGTAAAGSLIPGVANSTLVKGGIGAASALAGATAGDPIKGTTSSDMAERLQPYSNDVLQRAQAIADRPFTPYAGANPYQQTVDQRDAVAGQREGMQGFPAATQAGRDYMNNTLAGQNNFTPGQVSQASNPYLGQTTAGANVSQMGGVGSVANQIGGLAQTRNPYIGGQADRATTSTAAQAGKNALLGMNNPYLQNQIDAAQGDVSRQYNLTTAPQRQAQAVGSGSFGNTGVAQMQGEDQRQLASELGRVSSNMRMQDYGMQAQLGEGQAGREQQTNLTNAGLLNAGSQFNAGQSAGDLNRNTSAFQAQQNPMLQAMLSGYTTDAGNQFGTQQFNAGAANNMGQFNAGLSQNDLARNSSQAQNLSQFNSGVSNQNIGNAQNAWAGNNSLAAGMLGQNLNYANAPFAQQQQLFNMGTTGANQNAQGGMFDFSEFLRGQGYDDNQIKNLSNVVAQQAGGGGVTTTQQPGANPFATALGVGTGLWGMGRQFGWI